MKASKWSLSNHAVQPVSHDVWERNGVVILCLRLKRPDGQRVRLWIEMSAAEAKEIGEMARASRPKLIPDVG